MPLRDDLVGVAVPAVAAAVTLVLLGRHAVAYFPLFDDFAILGELPGVPVRRILAEPLGGFYRPLGLALFRAEAFFFGFTRPWGLGALSAALHVANALLLVLLLRRVGHSAPSSRAAGALLLVSPWAAEAFFWASAQFDLLATLAVLVVLLAVLAASRREEKGAALAAAGAGVAATAALLAKESAATLAAVAFFVVLSYLPKGPSSATRLAPVSLVLAGLTAAFLVVRSLVLPGLEGPYGNYMVLVAGGAGPRNLWSHAEAFLRLPFGASGAALAGLQAAWGGLLLLLVVRAAWRDARGTALRSLAFLASLAPVAALPTGPQSIPNGRLLYLPGVLLVLLLAGGAGEARRKPWYPGAAATSLLALGVASVAWQQSLWRSASALSRNVVAAVEPYASSDRPLFILNLPLRFEGGPHLLKSYAFRYAFKGRPVPPVRAQGVVLERDPARLRVVETGPDPFSEGAAGPGDRRLRLLLDDAWLR